MKRIYIVLVSLILFSCESKVKDKVIPFHSHNDYWQKKPFTDAFHAKFKSIEVDVFRKGDSLYVAHDYEEIKKGNTFSTMYLNPLKKALDTVATPCETTPLFLLVDIKKDATEVYTLLDSMLSKYDKILMKYEEGKVHENSVQIIISGDKPLSLLQKANQRYVFLDGTIKQLDENYSNKLIPIYSGDWTKYFKWDGKGEMSQKDLQLLQSIVEKAKLRNSYLRFWNTPNQTYEQRKNIYDTLSKYDSVIIGTDDIKEALDFQNNFN